MNTLGNNIIRLPLLFQIIIANYFIALSHRIKKLMTSSEYYLQECAIMNAQKS